jgi:hypothetical protein
VKIVDTTYNMILIMTIKFITYSARNVRLKSVQILDSLEDVLARSAVAKLENVSVRLSVFFLWLVWNEDEDVVAGADGIGRLLAVAEVEQTRCALRLCLRGVHLG